MEKTVWGLNLAIWTYVAIQHATAAPIPATWKMSCGDKLQNVHLSGTFTSPRSGAKMQFWVGKLVGQNPKTVGLVSVADQGCEAICEVTRLERFQKDLKPALLEMECEGSKLQAMRMPLHVQWVRKGNGFDAFLRLGSSIYGVEQTPLHVKVNQYAAVHLNEEDAQKYTNK